MTFDINTTISLEENRSRRNINMRYALLTSIFARTSGVFLQVLSLPVAAKYLGSSGFSIYAMLGAILSAMTLSNIGINQSTTLHLSKIKSQSNFSLEKEIFLSSIIIVFTISILITFLSYLLILYSPIISVIFSKHSYPEQESKLSALFVCTVFLVTQILSVFEAAQLAQQRQFQLNIAISIGTLFAAFAVWQVANSHPSVLAILVAVHLPVILARTVNASLIWTSVRPINTNLRRASRHIRQLMKDGLSFVSGTSIANFLCHQLSVLIVGIYSTPQVSASTAAVMNGIILASSVVALVMAPLSGALPEAHARRDHQWIRRAISRILCVNLLYGIFIFVIFGLFGQTLFHFWYHGAVSPDRVLLTGAACYFLFLVIEVTSFTYLSSVGKLHSTANWMLAKSILSAIAILTATKMGLPNLLFWILAVGNIGFSFVPLGLKSIKQYGQINDDHREN